MEGIRARFLITTAVLIAGCSHQTSFPYQKWAEKSDVPPASSERYNTLEKAALAVESSQAEALAKATTKKQRSQRTVLTRTTFFPQEKAIAIGIAAKGLSLVSSGMKQPGEFAYMPHDALQPHKLHPAWGFIGKVLAWRIRDYCANGDFDNAIRLCSLATQYGFFLTGGDAADAALGLSIVNQARISIVSNIPNLSATQLRALSGAVKRAYSARPSVMTTLENEHKVMLATIQLIQDSYQKSSYDALKLSMGQDGKDCLAYLNRLHNDESKRPAYFSGMAAEMEEEYKRWKTWAAQPTEQRKPRPKFKTERPWKWFARYYFRSGEPLLRMEDSTIALTRLFILDCELQRYVKIAKIAPKSIDTFDSELKTDPYSGRPFPYNAQGMVYRIYSVGSDLKDNGGDQTNSFREPDLILERS